MSEAKLQMDVRRYLLWCLDLTAVEWTASLVGTHLKPQARDKAKSMGVRPGWPDLQFLFPDGVTRYIELKTETGSLSAEQRAFRDRCAPHGIFAVCRSVEAVEATLRGWGAPLRNHPFASEAQPDAA